MSELVDSVDIRNRYQISRARFYQWLAKPSFPQPVHTYGNGTRVWRLEDIEAWRSQQLAS